MRKLKSNELKKVKGKVIPTLTTVLTVGAIALLTITVFKMYQASKGKVTLSDKYGIEWADAD